MSKDEKKSCRDCAHLSQSGMVLGPRWDMSLRGVGHTIGEPTVLSSVSCNQKSPNFNDKNLDNNSCEQFLRKKAGMTVAQQLEEQKQEEIKKQQLAEQARITKEHNKLSNRLKRNWYYISALIITLIGLILTIWKFVLG